MTQMLFEIPGNAIAKGRPRLGVVRGHAMAFTPKRTRSFEDIVRQTGLNAMQANNTPIVSGPVTLRLAFNREIPKSWSKAKRASAQANMLKPCGKPDLDNLVKAITDGLNGVVYLDDSQIYRIEASKQYSDTPGVAVAVYWN